MLSNGIRNPRRSLAICITLLLLSWASLGWGIWEMHAAGGGETFGSALKIGLALLPAILLPFMAANFWWAGRVTAKLKAGETALVRWRVVGDALAAFVAEDAERNLAGSDYVNDWTPPRQAPPEGIEIIFSRDGVLAHDIWFPLVRQGPYVIERVGILPHSPTSIEFVTVSTTVSSGTAFSIRRSRHVLRLPVASPDCPDAHAALAHFRAVLAGETIVNPDFYRSRIRFGLIAAPLSGIIGLLGYALLGNEAQTGEISMAILMVALGTGGTVAALLLALLAWRLDRKQRARA
jgi:hypothetical protein